MEWLRVGADQRSIEENEALKAILKSEFELRRVGALKNDLAAKKYGVIKVVAQSLPAQEAIRVLTEDLLDLAEYSDAYTFARNARHFRIQDDLESRTLLAQHLAHVDDLHWNNRADLSPDMLRIVLMTARNGLSHCGLPGLDALRQMEGLEMETYVAISQISLPEAIDYLVDQYRQWSNPQQALMALAPKYHRISSPADKELIFFGIMDLLYDDRPSQRSRGAHLAGLTGDLRYRDALTEMAATDPATETRVRETAARALESLKRAESLDYAIAANLAEHVIPDLERQHQRLLQKVEDGIDVELSVARLRGVTRLLNESREKLEALQSTLEGQ